jgi:hypothetical protein
MQAGPDQVPEDLLADLQAKVHAQEKAVAAKSH